MYQFGERLVADNHFNDHLVHEVPVQIYEGEKHKDIGFVQAYTRLFVRVNDVLYNRTTCIFVSRPGY
ncbi:hypothetical protein J31TS4_46350 [Paenibacillus sp. J31TS4]|uniref:hypothetical protein n=1 Tax=Paenibacillus sp. J31TS4 TaxID=2807195 RepID=UPI001B0CCDAA|nr:hypothetical protein [Paenibacillus sp. J31TS4]GIP41355.1 hypothetical protein J31TS4_46350 [Paenibacillus sp. J31TS4]